MEFNDAIVAILAGRARREPRNYYSSLLKSLDSPGQLLEQPDLTSTWQEFYSLLSNDGVKRNAHEDLKRWIGDGIQLVALGTELYPEALAHIYSPPPFLFYRGSWPKDWSSPFLIGVVGSRMAEPQAQRAAHELTRALAVQGVTIVSGLALGIDTVAHRSALEGASELPTIAVLGNGLDSVYPASNTALAREIVDRGGLLISQFEPGVATYPSNFLDRNRVIAGLCKGVMVVQAGAKSGSLATARYAMEEGREVFVTPGPALDERYAGSHRLIRDGATLVSEIDHIFEAFPDFEGRRVDPVSADPIDDDSKLILKLIGEDSSVHFEELRTKVGKAIDLELMQFELSGYIARLPGNFLQITELGRRACNPAK